MDESRVSENPRSIPPWAVAILVIIGLGIAFFTLVPVLFFFLFAMGGGQIG